MNQLYRLARHLRLVRGRADAGYSTEAVIVIALLTAMAVTAVGVISSEVMDAANSLSLE